MKIISAFAIGRLAPALYRNGYDEDAMTNIQDDELIALLEAGLCEER
jgi:hypothetical protein